MPRWPPKAPAGRSRPQPVAVEPPRDAAHGDVATNAAMVLAKPAGMAPRALAEKLAAQLATNPRYSVDGGCRAGLHQPHAQAGASGRRCCWPRLILAMPMAAPTMGQGSRSMSNMSRPIRPGRCMSAIAAARCSAMHWRVCLAKRAMTVSKEYYINDAGAQVDIAGALCLSALSRGAWRKDRRNSGRTLSWRLSETGRRSVGARIWPRVSTMPMNPSGSKPVRATAIAMMMDLIRDDLAALNIRHELFASERALHESGAVAETVEALAPGRPCLSGPLAAAQRRSARGLGRPRPIAVPRHQHFGDDIDRPLVKSDGSYTYFASDVAYSRDKISARLQGTDLRPRRRPRRLRQAAARPWPRPWRGRRSR